MISDKSKIIIELILVLLVALLIGLVFYAFRNEEIVYEIINLNPDYLIDLLDSAGVFSYLLLIILVIIEVIVPFIPPLILYVAAGLVFGGLLGGILMIIGNVLGAAIAFFLARRYGRRLIIRWIRPETMRRFDNYFQKHGVGAIFFLRLNPFTSSDIFSYLSGLTKMRFDRFMAATILGLTPLIFAETFAGQGILRFYKELAPFLIIGVVIYLIVTVILINRAKFKS